MKLVDKARKLPPFDVASGLGQLLLSLAPDLIERSSEPPPTKKRADGKWIARPPRRNDSGQFSPPCIEVNCTGCNANIHYEGPIPFRMALRHLAACEASGQAEICPEEIADAYLKDRAAFYVRRTGEKSALQQLREDLKKFQVRTI